MSRKYTLYPLFYFIVLVLRLLTLFGVVGPTIRSDPVFKIVWYLWVLTIFPIRPVDGIEFVRVQRILRSDSDGKWVRYRDCITCDKRRNSIYPRVRKSPIPESKMIWAFIGESIKRHLRETKSLRCFYPLLRLLWFDTEVICKPSYNFGCFSTDGLLFSELLDV